MDRSSKSSRWSEHRLSRRVQFYELDSAGIVHFSWYFRYMEEAEHALWREAGLSIASPDAAVAFPRIAASFEYHKPLRFEDVFDVHIRIAAIGEKSIRYICAIERDGLAIATGTAAIVCASRGPDGTMKSVPIPASIAGRFEVAEAPRT